MSAEKITGHCVCKRYTITIPRSTEMNLCLGHTPMGRYSAHIFANKAETTIDGPEPRVYTVKGIKGMDMTRAWCDGCGSGLWIKPEGVEEQIFVKAGLFDPGDVPAPSMETFTKDMESWEKVAASAKQWEKNHGGL